MPPPPPPPPPRRCRHLCVRFVDRGNPAAVIRTGQQRLRPAVQSRYPSARFIGNQAAGQEGTINWQCESRQKCTKARGDAGGGGNRSAGVPRGQAGHGRRLAGGRRQRASSGPLSVPLGASLCRSVSRSLPVM